jgi:phage tail-like protein
MPIVGANFGFALGQGAGSALDKRLSALRVDPYTSFNFLVEIEGILTGGFSECSGLQSEVEIEEYREGGLNDYVHRFAGRVKHPPLVLKHGLSPIDTLWVWHQNVARGEIERRNGTIYLLDQMRIPVVWWNFKNAFPIRWTGPDLRAGSNEVAFESVELAHQGLSRPEWEKWASRAIGAGAFGMKAAARLFGG